MSNLTLRTQLLSELTHRKNRNPSYSLRAFARDLQIGTTTLSDYLCQKRTFSKTNLQKVVEGLGLSPATQEQVFAEHKPKHRKNESSRERLLLEEDTFRLISDWYYLAIMNIASLKENNADPQWIADRLGLEVTQVQEAMDRLYRLDLLRKEGNTLVRTSKELTTTTDIPSPAIRKYHGQNLVLAEKALHTVSVELREFSAVTMSVNLNKLAEARDILVKAQDRIATLLSDENATEVYTLSCQLFPLLQPVIKDDLSGGLT